jgi:hypothetical protein
MVILLCSGFLNNDVSTERVKWDNRMNMYSELVLICLERLRQTMENGGEIGGSWLKFVLSAS